jgi:hypothetical protein
MLAGGFKNAAMAAGASGLMGSAAAILSLLSFPAEALYFVARAAAGRGGPIWAGAHFWGYGITGIPAHRGGLQSRCGEHRALALPRRGLGRPAHKARP